jgi:surface polysaccharide O-acyltransferase-like enzyme
MKNPRIFFISLLRILSCIAVVSIHAVSLNPLESTAAPTAYWLLRHGVISLTIWAVPVFTMISGAVILRTNKAANTTYVSQRFMRLLQLLMLWCLAYLIFYSIWQSAQFSFKEILLWPLIGPFYHLYYFVIILGLTAITPLLQETMTTISAKARWGMIGLFLLIGIFWRITPLTLTMFVPYIGYYLLGAELRDVKISQLGKKLLMGIGLLASGLTFIGLYIFTFVRPDSPKVLQLLLSHPNPVILGMSCCVFLVVANWQIEPRKHWRRILDWLAAQSLGVYILHPFVQAVLMKVFQLLANQGWLPLPIIILMIPASFGVSLFLTSMIKKIPYAEMPR